MSKKNIVSIDLDVEDLLNLTEPKKGTLEYDLNFIIDKGLDEFIKQQHDEKLKDREFIELFKRNYNEIVKFISLDPNHQIPVNCYTCLKGMDLSKQYGKPKM